MGSPEKRFRARRPSRVLRSWAHEVAGRRRHGQFLKHDCESGVGAVNRNGCHLAVRWDNHYFCTSAPKFSRFGRDSRFLLTKILVALCGNFGTGSSDRSLSSIAACSLRKLLRKQLSRSSGRVPCGTSFGVELWARCTIREERRSGIAAVAVFYTSEELDDPPNGRFWTLSPDGDVHPETLLAPAATGLAWLGVRHHPILTTKMLAGHRLVRVCGLGAQMRIFSPEVTVWAVFILTQNSNGNLRSYARLVRNRGLRGPRFIRGAL